MVDIIYKMGKCKISPVIKYIHIKGMIIYGVHERLVEILPWESLFYFIVKQAW